MVDRVGEYEWDLFISHASEDKATFVRPLADALKEVGVRVWYDDFTLELGDSLSKSIDRGLLNSRFGLVVISPHFIRKPWPEYEFRTLVSREIDEDKVIIPIWHGVTRMEVKKFGGRLVEKFATDTRHMNPEEIVLQILRVVRRDIYDAVSREKLSQMFNERLALDDLQQELDRMRMQVEELQGELSQHQCPFCKSAVMQRVIAPADASEDDWDVRETFDCGYQAYGGQIEHICPADPHFPSLSDYELRSNHFAGNQSLPWECHPTPRTRWARLLPLRMRQGATLEDAEKQVQDEFAEHMSARQRLLSPREYVEEEESPRLR